MPRWSIALAWFASGCSAAAVGVPVADSAFSPTPNPEILRQVEALGFEIVQFGTVPEEEAEAIYQDRLQGCMASRGFEYFPPGQRSGEAEAFVPGTIVLSDGRSVPHEEMAALYGFGLAEEILIFARDPEGERAPKQQADPNFLYLESLSPAGQDSYYEMLDDDQNGCTAVVGASFELPAVQVDYDVLIELAYEDPRIYEFVDDWVSCMGKIGYSYDDPSGPIEEFEERLAELVRKYNARFAADPGDGDVVPDQVAAIEALQSEEIAVAIDSQTCGGTTYERQQLLDGVMVELQAAID